MFTAMQDFDCLTPLGDGVCKGFWVEGDVTEWLVDIKKTGEPWWFRNEDFRFGATVTNRRDKVSPFNKPNQKLAKQIERYKKNGWL